MSELSGGRAGGSAGGPAEEPAGGAGGGVTGPTLQQSLEVIQSTIQQAGPGFYVEYLARLHYMQATVIQGERKRADEAEAELQARELHHFEAEQENARLSGYRVEYERLQRQLASPPPGWFVFGTHIDAPDVALEFWGDEGGVPIWERRRV